MIFHTNNGYVINEKQGEREKEKRKKTNKHQHTQMELMAALQLSPRSASIMGNQIKANRA